MFFKAKIIVIKPMTIAKFNLRSYCKGGHWHTMKIQTPQICPFGDRTKMKITIAHNFRFSSKKNSNKGLLNKFLTWMWPHSWSSDKLRLSKRNLLNDIGIKSNSWFFDKFSSKMSKFSQLHKYGFLKIVDGHEQLSKTVQCVQLRGWCFSKSIARIIHQFHCLQHCTCIQYNFLLFQYCVQKVFEWSYLLFVLHGDLVGHKSRGNVSMNELEKISNTCIVGNFQIKESMKPPK